MTPWIMGQQGMSMMMCDNIAESVESPRFVSRSEARKLILGFGCDKVQGQDKGDYNDTQKAWTQAKNSEQMAASSLQAARIPTIGKPQ